MKVVESYRLANRDAHKQKASSPSQEEDHVCSGLLPHLLPQLEDQRRQRVHGRGTQFRALVQRSNNWMNDPGGVVSEVQGLRQAVHSL